MRRLGDLLFGTAFVMLAGLAAQSCAYAPDFEDGQLHCSTQGTCPKGYSCRPGEGNTCWKAGTVAHTPSVDDFPGHWLFQTGSSQTINCSDGSNNTTSIATDFVDVMKGTATALQASYYCDWNLTLNTPPTKTGLPAGQTCMSMTTDTKTKVITTFTWHGVKFELGSANGVTARLDAEISTDYVTTEPATGSCTVKISGTLMNATP